MNPKNQATASQPADRGRLLLRKNALYEQDDVASFLGTTVRSLAQWRADGTGPQFRKIRKRIVYLGQDVNDWVLGQQGLSDADSAHRNPSS